MGQSWFAWKGIDCRAMGIVLVGPAAIIRPEERVKHVTLPGVSGDLTELEGENIYNSYIQTVSFHVQGGYRVRDVYTWLRGEGYVTFSGEPDRRQKARIIGAVTLNRHSYNLDWWTGEVQFYCHPLKELLQETPVTVTTSGSTVRNFGDVIARPLYRVTASGATVVLGAAGNGVPSANAVTVTGQQSGWVFIVDSETMEVWNSDMTGRITAYSSGEFPVLGVGDNTLTFSGASKVEITKRERYL